MDARDQQRSARDRPPADTPPGASALGVRLLNPAVGDDAELVDRLARLINDVYESAESGLWREGAARTTGPELAEMIRAEQIAVATQNGEIVGSVRVHDVANDASEFGLLVAAPEHRGVGVGRALVDFAEGRSRDRGLRAIQAELLVPRTWRHPIKEFLKGWYGRRGYRIVDTRSMTGAYPRLAPLLATPCYLTVYEKPLLVA